MLEKFRDEIDNIDAALAELLERRIEAAREIGNCKRRYGQPVTDAEREEKILTRVSNSVKNRENVPYITRVWRQFMEISREVQTSGGELNTDMPHIRGLIDKARAPVADPAVLFQGIEGSNSHEAATAYFGENVRAFGVPDFEKLCAALKEGGADYGILPLENNTTGPVARVRELIDKYGLYITGEQNLRIEHCLLASAGASLDDIEQITSHEQALLQCSDFLEARRSIRCAAGANTAICARDTASEGNIKKAAIASPFAAELFGLDTLSNTISNNPNNCTRFVVVSNFPELRDGHDKVSLLFTVRHRTGALHRILSIFADYRLNMTKLESIPLGGADFEYLFMADFIGDITRSDTQKALSAINGECGRVRVLGNYPNKRRNIVLTGMSGCGKNSIGKALAERLGMAYTDIDEQIEQRAGCGISEIFAKKGEAAFRDMESDVTAKTASMGGLVISIGEGTMMREKNVRALRRTGLIFFINRPVSEILACVDLSNRPLLAAEPQKIYELYEKRLPVYQATADHEVTNDGKMEYTVEAMDALIEYLKGGKEEYSQI